MTEKALQTTTPKAAELVPITQEFGLTDNQVALIKSQIAPGSTDDELRYFLTVAKKTGLDAFTRQIYSIKRKSWNKDKKAYDEKVTIQTGIDGYRAIAVRTGELAGIDDAIYNTEEADHPDKASVSVYRLVGGVRCPFTATARWKEYCQMKDEYENNQKTGKQVPSGLWEKMPYLMLAKCAEALALRKAFPNELSGIYTAEEMGQADNATAERPHSRTKKPEATAVIDVAPTEAKTKLPEVNNKAIHAVWAELAKAHGWDKDEAEGRRKATLKALYQVESNNDLTVEQAEDFVRRAKSGVERAEATKAEAEKAKAAEEGVKDVQAVAEAFGGKVIETCPTCKKDFEDDGNKTGDAEAIRFAGECNGCLGGKEAK